MAAFDQTITLAASPEAIVSAIEASASDHPLQTLQPGRLMILERGEWGLVYILHPEPDFTTRLRLVVDSVHNVRSAFDGKSPRDALLSLLMLPTDSTGTLAVNASQHLEELKQASAGNKVSLEAAPAAEAASVYEIASQRRAVKTPRKTARQKRSVTAIVASGLLAIIGILLRMGYSDEALWNLSRSREPIQFESDDISLVIRVIGVLLAGATCMKCVT